MKINIDIIKYEDKIILQNLIQLYRYDSSEFDNHVMNQHGLYDYRYLDHQWADDFRRPYLIKVNGEIAGFALIILDVPKAYTACSVAEKTNIMSDFFILKKHRNKGIGTTAAFTIFNQHRGYWEVKQTKNNLPAYKFWKDVISRYPNGKLEEDKILPCAKWDGTLLIFKNI